MPLEFHLLWVKIKGLSAESGTVREGMQHTHLAKWSPHVGDVKYSPATTSLAPAMFLCDTPFPSPNPSIPGVCRTCLMRPMAVAHRVLPVSIRPDPSPPRIKCCLASPVDRPEHHTQILWYNSFTPHSKLLFFKIFITSHLILTRFVTFPRCRALCKRHTCMRNDGVNNDDDEKMGEDDEKRTFVIIINGFIPIRSVFKTVCLISLERLSFSLSLHLNCKPSECCGSDLYPVISSPGISAHPACTTPFLSFLARTVSHLISLERAQKCL